jgi:hypothetical protein
MGHQGESDDRTVLLGHGRSVTGGAVVGHYECVPSEGVSTSATSSSSAERVSTRPQNVQPQLGPDTPAQEEYRAPEAKLFPRNR